MIFAAVAFACAIVLDAVAFIIWDVGTRPPLVLARDVLRGARQPAVLGRGIVRFAAGGALLILAAVIARPAIPSAAAFSVLETGMLIVALLIEALLGTELRARARRR